MEIVLVALLGFVVGLPLSELADATRDRSGGGRTWLTCPSCQANVPSSSLLSVNPTCNTCGLARDGISRPAVMVVTSIAFVVSVWGTEASLRWVPVLLIVSALVTLAAIDVRRYRLPDALLFPSIGVGSVAIVAVSLIEGVGDHILPAVIAGLVYFVALFIPSVISPGGLAFGDVKFALLLGLLIGWTRASVTEGIVLVIYALIAGMFLGIVSGLFVGVVRRVISPNFLPDPDFPPPDDGSPVPLLRTAFPFGPALAVSAILMMSLSSSVIGSAGVLGL